VKRLLPAAVLLAGCSLALDFNDECSSNEACAQGLVCVEGLCVEGEADAGAPDTTRVTNADCPTVYGVPADKARDPDVLLLGSLLSSSGQLSGFGPPMEKAIDLAVDEINQGGGIDGKKLAVLHCDDGTDATKGIAAAKHLVDDVHVPAIIGAAASGVTIEVFNQVALPAGVLMISPSATSPALTDLPDRGLLWRTAPSDAIQGAAVAQYLLHGDFQKVAVVGRDDTYGNGLQEAIREGLCASDAARCAEDRYQSHRYDPDHFVEGQSTALTNLQDFAPDVVVLIGYLDDGANFLKLAGGAGVHKIILTDGTKDTQLLDRVHDDTLMTNIVGTAPAEPSGENYRAFTFRYRSKWDADPGVFTAQSYDALYLLAYALGALDGKAPIDGGHIAAQLRRLTGGTTKYDVGGADFNRGVQALRKSADATIDFEGASGSLNFNAAKGEAASNIEGWHFDVDAHRILTLGLIYCADGSYHTPMDTGGAPAPDVCSR
jgi:branched-chain amino acid transport system substrate-binding protein